jgi:hypothetical protein
MARSFQIHPADNVATLLEDCGAEVLEIVGPAPHTLAPHGEIPRGHKVALGGIPAGAPVIKYGVRIGVSTAAIAWGEWVHCHNCRSEYDDCPPAVGVDDE